MLPLAVGVGGVVVGGGVGGVVVGGGVGGVVVGGGVGGVVVGGGVGVGVDGYGSGWHLVHVCKSKGASDDTWQDLQVSACEAVTGCDDRHYTMIMPMLLVQLLELILKSVALY